MKRITLFLMTIIVLTSTISAQPDSTAVLKDSTDTQIEYVDTPSAKSSTKSSKANKSFPFPSSFNNNQALLIPIVAITAVFGLPVLIVFISFFFNYKNKKAKYKLAEKALESGNPIPESLFQEANNNNIQRKGITNIFTGIGLFIFLWTITEEFSIGSIGLLVMFTGFGQLVIHYTQKNKEQNSSKQDSDSDSQTEE